MKEEFIMKPSSRFPGAIGGKTPAKNTHGFGKKITAVIAASAIALCGTATTAFADDTANDLGKKIVNTYTSQNGNGMTFEKVSHPSNGLQTADGVVDYIGNGAITEEDQGQGDRGQSYSSLPPRTAIGCMWAPCTAVLACRTSFRVVSHPTWA